MKVIFIEPKITLKESINEEIFFEAYKKEVKNYVIDIIEINKVMMYMNS